MPVGLRGTSVAVTAERIDGRGPPPKIGSGHFSVRARQGFPEAYSTRRNAGIYPAISGKCRIRCIGRWFWGFCHGVFPMEYLMWGKGRLKTIISFSDDLFIEK